MTEARATAARSARRADGARLLAAYQRFVLWYFGQLVLLIFARLASPAAEWSSLGAALFLVATVAALLTAAGVVLSGYRAASAAGSDVAWLWALGLLVPLVSLPTFVLLGRNASAAGREAGLPFGLLGLPKRPRSAD